MDKFLAEWLIYIVMGLVFAAVGGAWYFINKTKRKRPPVPVELSNVPPAPDRNKPPEEVFIDNLVAVDARVYDNSTRTVKNETIPADAVRQMRHDFGNLGRRWYRDGHWRYAVVRLTSNTYIPVGEYMDLSLKNPPERLHRALQQQETATFYKPRDNRGLLAKYGHYLLFAGVVIVILFLWGANMMKG